MRGRIKEKISTIYAIKYQVYCMENTVQWSANTVQLSRLTVVSREAKKKQHARASSGLRDHYSELFTRMAALKF